MFVSGLVYLAVPLGVVVQLLVIVVLFPSFLLSGDRRTFGFALLA